MRTVAMPHMTHERKRDRQKDALFDADRDDSRSGRNRQHEFAATLTKDISKALDVDHARGDGEDDARKHAAWQVLQRACQE